jgi:hypothetical protein
VKLLIALLALITVAPSAYANSRYKERARAYAEQQKREQEARGQAIDQYFNNERAANIAKFAAKHGGYTNLRKERDYGGYTHYYFTTGDNLECERNFMNDYFTCYDANNQGYNLPDPTPRKKRKSTGSWIFDNIDRWY